MHTYIYVTHIYNTYIIYVYISKLEMHQFFEKMLHKKPFSLFYMAALPLNLEFPTSKMTKAFKTCTL